MADDDFKMVKSGRGLGELGLTEEDCLPEKSMELFGLPGWSQADPKERSIVILKALGFRESDIAEAVGLSEERVELVQQRVDPDHRLALTQRDVLVFRLAMFNQLETAALTYITPKKLMAETAKNLGMLATMLADRAETLNQQLMQYDQLHPDERGENLDPLEKLKRLSVINVETVVPDRVKKPPKPAKGGRI